MFENLIESKTTKKQSHVGQTRPLVPGAHGRDHSRRRQGRPRARPRAIKNRSGRHHHGLPQAAGAAAAAARPAAAGRHRGAEPAAQGLPDGDAADRHPEGHSAGRSEREAVRCRGLHRQGRRGRHRRRDRGRDRSGHRRDVPRGAVDDPVAADLHPEAALSAGAAERRDRRAGSSCSTWWTPPATPSRQLLQGAQDDANPAFDEPAREAIVKGVFKPAKFKGAPVRQLVQQAISFKQIGSITRRGGNITDECRSDFTSGVTMGWFAKGIVVVMAIMSI